MKMIMLPNEKCFIKTRRHLRRGKKKERDKNIGIIIKSFDLITRKIDKKR